MTMTEMFAEKSVTLNIRKPKYETKLIKVLDDRHLETKKNKNYVEVELKSAPDKKYMNKLLTDYFALSGTIKEEEVKYWIKCNYSNRNLSVGRYSATKFNHFVDTLGVVV